MLSSTQTTIEGRGCVVSSTKRIKIDLSLPGNDERSLSKIESDRDSHRQQFKMRDMTRTSFTDSKTQRISK